MASEPSTVQDEGEGKPNETCDKCGRKIVLVTGHTDYYRHIWSDSRDCHDAEFAETERIGCFNKAQPVRLSTSPRQPQLPLKHWQSTCDTTLSGHQVIARDGEAPYAYTCAGVAQEICDAVNAFKSAPRQPESQPLRWEMIEGEVILRCPHGLRANQGCTKCGTDAPLSDTEATARNYWGKSFAAPVEPAQTFEEWVGSNISLLLLAERLICHFEGVRDSSGDDRDCEIRAWLKAFNAARLSPPARQPQPITQAGGNSIEDLPSECKNCGLKIEMMDFASKRKWCHIHNNRFWCAEGQGHAEPKFVDTSPPRQPESQPEARQIIEDLLELAGEHNPQHPDMTAFDVCPENHPDCCGHCEITHAARDFLKAAPRQPESRPLKFHGLGHLRDQVSQAIHDHGHAGRNDISSYLQVAFDAITHAGNCPEFKVAAPIEEGGREEG